MQLYCLVVGKAHSLCASVTLPCMMGRSGLRGGFCWTSVRASSPEEQSARLNIISFPMGKSLSKSKSQIEGELVGKGKGMNKQIM